MNKVVPGSGLYVVFRNDDGSIFFSFRGNDREYDPTCAQPVASTNDRQKAQEICAYGLLGAYRKMVSYLAGCGDSDAKRMIEMEGKPIPENLLRFE